MKQLGGIIDLALKGIALAMAVAVVVLGILDAITVETSVTMLAIGLFALALYVLGNTEEPCGGAKEAVRSLSASWSIACKASTTAWKRVLRFIIPHTTSESGDKCNNCSSFK